MADSSTESVLSVVTTVNSKLSDLPIEDGQLIFIRDKHEVAFDFGGQRKIYNQIEELSSEDARTSLLAPVTDRYYFVMDPPALWRYQESGWVQITTPPEDLEKYEQFVVNISGDITAGYTSDKTYAEIFAAYNAGRPCVARYTTFSTITLPLAKMDKDYVAFGSTAFSTVSMVTGVTIVITAANITDVIYSEYSPQIKILDSGILYGDGAGVINGVTGTDGQVIGFDSDGTPVAQDLQISDINKLQDNLSTIEQSAKDYADTLSKRVVGSVDDDGNFIIMFDEPFWEG